LQRKVRLAILDSGRKVADGAPDQLMADIGYSVVEVELADPTANRPAVAAIPGVASIAQVGTRLRVLIDPARTRPEDYLRANLRASDIEAETRLVEPNLEDVFMAVTR
jgi:ABC-2 type transport system ATP-binding protein